MSPTEFSGVWADHPDDSADVTLIKQGRWVETASGSCGGVRMAVEHLQRQLDDAHHIQADLIDTEQALQDGFLRYFGAHHELQDEIRAASEVVASKVVDMAASLMAPHVSALDGVLGHRWRGGDGDALAAGDLAACAPDRRYPRSARHAGAAILDF